MWQGPAFHWAVTACLVWFGMWVVGIPIHSLFWLVQSPERDWVGKLFQHSHLQWGIGGWGEWLIHCSLEHTAKLRPPQTPLCSFRGFMMKVVQMKMYLFILVECLKGLIWMMKCIVAFQLMHSLVSLLISIFGSVFNRLALASFLEWVTAWTPGAAWASCPSMLLPAQPAWPESHSHHCRRTSVSNLGDETWLELGGRMPDSWRNNRLYLLELSCNIRAVRWGLYQPGHSLEVGSLRPWVVSWRAPHFGSFSSLRFMNVINSKSRQDRHNTIKLEMPWNCQLIMKGLYTRDALK